MDENIEGATIIPVSWLITWKLKELSPGRYVIADMKHQKVIRVIDVLPVIDNLELNYKMVVERKE
jgi:hypothetical protein